MKHVNISIYGKVQKTGFRFMSMQYAVKIGVTGFVRYTSECNLYMEVEGPSDKLEAFINWCRSGTIWSRASQITIEWGEVHGYKNYQIY
jgi:acylphosphatase